MSEALVQPGNCPQASVDPTSPHPAPTIEDARKWGMVEAAHINGGKEWFGYVHRCVQQPRLSRFDKYSRSTKSVQSTWRVDGEDVGSLESAVDELAYPPRFTATELLVLAQIGREPADYRKVHPYEITSTLRDKGAIAYGPPGRCCRTLSDAEVLDALGRAESNASGNPEWEAVSAKVKQARTAISKATGDA